MYKLQYAIHPVTSEMRKYTGERYSYTLTDQQMPSESGTVSMDQANAHPSDLWHEN